MADDDLTAEMARKVATVRLLINDPRNTSGNVFSDDEVAAFLTLEAGVVKMAAAQALDVIASNEALVSKVITDGDLSTNGAQTAKAIRDNAAALRAQVISERARTEADSEDGFFFGVVDIAGPRLSPENTYWG